VEGDVYYETRYRVSDPGSFPARRHRLLSLAQANVLLDSVSYRVRPERRGLGCGSGIMECWVVSEKMRYILDFSVIPKPQVHLCQDNLRDQAWALRVHLAQ